MNIWDPHMKSNCFHLFASTEAWQLRTYLVSERLYLVNDKNQEYALVSFSLNPNGCLCTPFCLHNYFLKDQY